MLVWVFEHVTLASPAFPFRYMALLSSALSVYSSHMIPVHAEEELFLHLISMTSYRHVVGAIDRSRCYECCNMPVPADTLKAYFWIRWIALQFADQFDRAMAQAFSHCPVNADSGFDPWPIIPPMSYAHILLNYCRHCNLTSFRHRYLTHLL